MQIANADDDGKGNEENIMSRNIAIQNSANCADSGITKSNETRRSNIDVTTNNASDPGGKEETMEKDMNQDSNCADKGTTEGDAINNASQSGELNGKEEVMNDRMRAVQIVNKLIVSRMALGREYSRDQFDESLQLFVGECKKLSEISDVDVQLVLAVLLRDRHVLNVGSCRGWQRLSMGA